MREGVLMEGANTEDGYVNISMRANTFKDEVWMIAQDYHKHLKVPGMLLFFKIN